MLPDIPLTPRPEVPVLAPLSWSADRDGLRADDPDGTVVTVQPRDRVVADEALDEDGEPVETTEAVTRWVVYLNGRARSEHADRDEAVRMLESYRQSPGGLAGFRTA